MSQHIRKVSMRSGWTACAAATALCFVLALPGSARAQEQEECEIPSAGEASDKPISYEDRQAILDLIANFSWVFNEPNVPPDQRKTQLETIFASEFKFQVCPREGAPVFSTDNHAKLFEEIDKIYKALATQFKQSAHYVTNTVLTAATSGAVEEKSLMLLVLTDTVPSIDYSAIVRGIIEKNPSTGEWQFKNRTIILGVSADSYAR